MPRRTNRKRAPKRRNAPKPKPSPQRSLVARTNAQLEACEEMYLRALSNPFDPLIRGKVCYPSFPAKQSAKYVATALINVNIGTNGVGWLMVDPTPSNSNNAIYYTDSSYSGTLASVLTTTIGSGVVAATFNSPTTSSPFIESYAGHQFRMIAAGMKFRYTGTNLNKGGSVFALNSPQQVSLNGYPLGSLSASAISREHRVEDIYQAVVVPPSHEEDVEWKDIDQIFPWSDGGGTAAAPISALGFFGTPGNTFVVKLIVHYEVAGPGYNQFATLSHIGRAQVVQSITTAAASSAYGMPQGSYVDQFANTLKRISQNPVVRTAGDMVMQLGFAYASRRLGLTGPANSTRAGLIEGSTGRIAIDVD